MNDIAQDGVSGAYPGLQVAMGPAPISSDDFVKAFASYEGPFTPNQAGYGPYVSQTADNIVGGVQSADSVGAPTTTAVAPIGISQQAMTQPKKSGTEK